MGKGDPGGNKCLAVPKIEQNRSNWCWCACGVSVIRWYFPNSKVAQRKFCKFCWGGKVVNWRATEPRVCKGLWHWDVGANIKWVGTWTPNNIWLSFETHIQGGNPPIVGTETPPHSLVLCGYKVKAGKRKVRLMDPDNGGYKWRSLKKLRKTNDLESMILTSKQVH